MKKTQRNQSVFVLLQNFMDCVKSEPVYKKIGNPAQYLNSMLTLQLLGEAAILIDLP